MQESPKQWMIKAQTNEKWMSSKVPLGRLNFSSLLKTTSALHSTERKRADNFKSQWFLSYLHITDLSKKVHSHPTFGLSADNNEDFSCGTNQEQEESPIHNQALWAVSKPDGCLFWNVLLFDLSLTTPLTFEFWRQLGQHPQNRSLGWAAWRSIATATLLPHRGSLSHLLGFLNPESRAPAASLSSISPSSFHSSPFLCTENNTCQILGQKGFLSFTSISNAQLTSRIIFLS